MRPSMLPTLPSKRARLPFTPWNSEAIVLPRSSTASAKSWMSGGFPVGVGHEKLLHGHKVLVHFGGLGRGVIRPRLQQAHFHVPTPTLAQERGHKDSLTMWTSAVYSTWRLGHLAQSPGSRAGSGTIGAVASSPAGFEPADRPIANRVLSPLSYGDCEGEERPLACADCTRPGPSHCP